jgi:hypothetical protein
MIPAIGPVIGDSTGNPLWANSNRWAKRIEVPPDSVWRVRCKPPCATFLQAQIPKKPVNFLRCRVAPRLRKALIICNGGISGVAVLIPLSRLNNKQHFRKVM